MCVGLDFKRLIREDFSEKVPLKPRNDGKLAMQGVGGGAFHREEPTCTRILGKKRKKPTMLAVRQPETYCGGRLDLLNYKRTLGL